MYRGNWARAVLSRVMAVCVVSLLVAGLGVMVGNFESAEVDRMSDQELRKYVKDESGGTFLERYFIGLIGGAVFVTLVEALAGGLRAVVPDVPQPPASAPRRRQ